jgi:hypothetical protein
MDQKEILEKAGATLDELTKKVSERDKKVEQIEKKLFSIEKGLISQAEPERTSYTLLDAKSDYLRGKTAPVPYWNDYTQKRFQEYIQAVHNKDWSHIQKEFYDNTKTAPVTTAQTGVDKWTPIEFLPELVRLVFVNSMVLKKCTIVPMSRDLIDLPVPGPSGGVTDAATYLGMWYGAKFTSAAGTSTRGGNIDASAITTNRLRMQSDKAYAASVIAKEDLMDPANEGLALVA